MAILEDTRAFVTRNLLKQLKQPPVPAHGPSNVKSAVMQTRLPFPVVKSKPADAKCIIRKPKPAKLRLEVHPTFASPVLSEAKLPGEDQLVKELFGDTRAFVTRGLIRRLTETVRPPRPRPGMIVSDSESSRGGTSSDDDDDNDAWSMGSLASQRRRGSPLGGVADALSCKRKHRSQQGPINADGPTRGKKRGSSMPGSDSDRPDEDDGAYWTSGMEWVEGTEYVEVFRCNQCSHSIDMFRYACRYCIDSQDEYKTYDLCLQCFQAFFPLHHEHPRESFIQIAIPTISQAMVRSTPAPSSNVSGPEDCPAVASSSTAADADVAPMNAMTLAGFEPDQFDEQYDAALDDLSIVYGSGKPRCCELCLEDTSAGPFVGEKPFLYPSSLQKKTKHFWIHDACARHSPEVLVTADNVWYNVVKAVRRGRSIVRISCVL